MTASATLASSCTLIYEVGLVLRPAGGPEHCASCRRGTVKNSVCRGPKTTAGQGRLSDSVLRRGDTVAVAGAGTQGGEPVAESHAGRELARPRAPQPLAWAALVVFAGRWRLRPRGLPASAGRQARGSGLGRRRICSARSSCAPTASSPSHWRRRITARTAASNRSAPRSKYPLRIHFRTGCHGRPERDRRQPDLRDRAGQQARHVPDESAAQRTAGIESCGRNHCVREGRRIMVIRGSGPEQTDPAVELRAGQRGQDLAQNVFLESGDVVLVP